MALEDQQQLGPLGEVPRLVAPRPKDVAAVVAVVAPVDRPVGAVVLPNHQAIGLGGLALNDVVGQQRGAVEKALVSRGLEGGQAGLGRVHVGVLTAVVGKVRMRVGLVCIQAELRLPEMALHQRKGFVQRVTRLADASEQRMRTGEQHEGQPIAVVGRIDDRGAPAISVALPGVAAGLGVAVKVAQERQRVVHVLRVRRRV